MVFAPSPGDHLHRLPLKGEACLTLRRVRGQRVLEVAEGLALLQCLPECRSARARRASPHCSAKSSLISKACDDSIGSTHSHRSLSRGSSAPAASGPARNRSSPDSRWSQWLLSPIGSREFSAQISPSRSMANDRAAPSLRSGGLSLRLTSKSPTHPTGTGRTQPAGPVRQTAAVHHPRTRATGP